MALQPNDGREPPGEILLIRAERILITRHMSRKTTKVYLHWIRRFLRAHPDSDPRSLREPEVNRFLTRLAVDLGVSAATQNQAASALKFFYARVLGEPLEPLEVVKAKRAKRMRTPLNPDEISALLAHLSGQPLLVCLLLFGAGLRLTEALMLRVKDIDMKQREILVRAGKGDKDRVTILPTVLIDPLREQLAKVKAQHNLDLEKGLGRAPMPEALGRKYPSAAREWPWQWVFPASSHYVDKKTGMRHRHHLHESVIQKAVRRAAQQAGLTKHATPHILRYSFATQMVNQLVDLATLKELLGHEDIRTTQHYIHVLTQGNHGVVSPLDGLTRDYGTALLGLDANEKAGQNGHTKGTGGGKSAGQNVQIPPGTESADGEDPDGPSGAGPFKQ